MQARKFEDAGKPRARPGMQGREEGWACPGPPSAQRAHPAGARGSSAVRGGWGRHQPGFYLPTLTVALLIPRTSACHRPNSHQDPTTSRIAATAHLLEGAAGPAPGSHRLRACPDRKGAGARAGPTPQRQLSWGPALHPKDGGQSTQDTGVTAPP